MPDAAAIAQDFDAAFGCRPDAVFFAPGRVNLIGEHTDYNGGRVLPAAINVGTSFAVAKTAGTLVNVRSELFNETVSFDVSAISGRVASGHWSDYVVGTLQQLHDIHGQITGLDVLVTSDMPHGGGLSSSASFCVGLACALVETMGMALERLGLIRIAQAVENEFIGLDCGVMDPFAVTMGRAGHCMLLDCDSMQWELVPIAGDDYQIVIANSMVPRKLSASNYNQRRSECEQALAILRQDIDLAALCKFTVEQVESSAALARRDVLLRRARHAAGENARVGLSVNALKHGRLDEFGALMTASHASLRDDYEVSCCELDILVDAALAQPGALGSRMTGAGFGGCTVSLVASDAVGDFVANVANAYAEKTARRAQMHTGRPGDGARRIL